MADEREKRTGALVALLLCTLVVGGSAGVVLGWGVMPIPWSAEQVSALSLESQLDYVVLVAGGFADSGDIDLATSRLLGLVDEDTTWSQVADLARLAGLYEGSQGRPGTASQVEALIQKVWGTPQSTDVFVYSRAREVRSCLAILLAAFLVGLSGAVWTLVRVLKRSQAAPLSADIESGKEAGQGTIHSASLAVRRQELVRDADEISGKDTAVSALDSALKDESKEESETDADPATESFPVVLDEPQPDPSQVPDSALDELLEILDDYSEPGQDALQAMSEQHFSASYVHGDDEYSVSFNLEDAEGAFLGECGVSLAEVMGGGTPQRAVAFEVWMFDRSDVQTASQILCSEWAMQDATMRALLEPRGEMSIAEKGTLVTFDRLSTIVTFRVNDVAMGMESAGPQDAWFERLGFDIRASVKKVPSV